MVKPDIVFFGSGPVAAKSLELLANNFTVTAVVTKPKPAHHRGDFPVISTANRMGLTVHEVRNRKELSELIATTPFQTDAGVLIDFGIIVGQDVIDYFPKGIVNAHFSLLPEWRGADPITFSVLSGQSSTGVSLMLLVEAMDEGPLIAFGEMAISKDITSPVLTEKLIVLSHELLVHELPEYLSGNRELHEQSVTGRQVSYSRKLTKQDGILDFHKSAVELERQIRAFAEWPKSSTKLADIDVIITQASAASLELESGKILVRDKRLYIACAKGSLEVRELKPAGKTAMTASAFLAGYHNRIESL